MSLFGAWIDEDGLPVFRYDADPATTPEATWDPVVSLPTNRHWAVIGNRRISAIVDNFGSVALFDEHDGIRYVTAPDPFGSGESVVDGEVASVERCWFGPTWFDVALGVAGLEIRRSIILPEGENPWLLVRVSLRSRCERPRTFEHIERWALRPRMMTIGVTPARAKANAAAAVTYEVRSEGRRVVATELRTPEADRLAARKWSASFGSPHIVVLEAVGPTGGSAGASSSTHPLLHVATSVALEPGECADLWFRFGLDDGSPLDDPAALALQWREKLADRLPRASAGAAPVAAREVPWHAALLTGSVCADGVLGNHTLDQGSVYSHLVGFNGAARDPLQHALPLVYSEPDIALSVLRNTCAWASPDGDLPYGLDGAKRPWTSQWQPSDQNLWALWLAAEYAAATGDLAAFADPVQFHPVHRAEPVPLEEHLRRQFAFLVDGVGLGEHGHLRIRNADWNDVVISTSGVPHDEMVEKGESVLNSAMAAWVLPVYAGLCERLGDSGTAAVARKFAESLRSAVADEWNGRWFRRAYGPGCEPIGEKDLWLEVQPWAILCGAASADQAEQLLRRIDEGPRSHSPLGTRVRWPVGADHPVAARGEVTNGGIWYSINATLIWAASRHDPDLAWDEWRRMTLSSHEAAYPEIWEGTISGPDAYNSPEAARAGRTWVLPEHGVGMQGFPVGNLHSHAQPLFAYLRLMGVEPCDDGAIRAAGPARRAQARFESRVLTIEADGSGRATVAGPVVVETRYGRTEGGPGEVKW